MIIRVLGSAAGGGFPQWNCACANCSRLRAGTLRSKSRTQAQLAISPFGQEWFLVGASPDLRLQIEATPALFPRTGMRGSPIAGVVLLSAELDHVLGLLSLRERHSFLIYSTESVRRLVSGENSFFRMLERDAGQTRWMDLHPGARTPLRSPSGEESGLICEPLSVGKRFPSYATAENRANLILAEAVLGLLLEDSAGHRVFYAPGLLDLSAELIKLFSTCHLLLLDGTFWTDDELPRATGSGQTAREMGHLPVGGPDGLIARLAGLRGPRKVLMHINNTNPILDEESAEYRQTVAAGWEVAEDGWECTF
jgi:pyrroloquinoline quinone biosynthesis protein B